MTTQDPQEETFEQKLFRWYKMDAQLSALKKDEMALRKELFNHYFPKPDEGVNSTPFENGWVIKGEHKINRKIDVQMLTVLTAELHAKGLPMAELIDYKPQLSVTEYRKLQGVKKTLFDQILEISDGAPALSVVKPKKG
jgi:hypothetical protein